MFPIIFYKILNSTHHVRNSNTGLTPTLLETTACFADSSLSSFPLIHLIYASPPLFQQPNTRLLVVGLVWGSCSVSFGLASVNVRFWWLNEKVPTICATLIVIKLRFDFYILVSRYIFYLHFYTNFCICYMLVLFTLLIRPNIN